MITLNRSVVLKRVYAPTSFRHGSDRSWRPSTAIGVKVNDPFA